MSAYPKLPDKTRGAGGPITVRLCRHPSGDKGETCWGTWEEATREICVEEKAPRSIQWKTFFHEMTHAALDDTGLSSLLAADSEEALCEAMATARLQELNWSLGIRE